MCGPSRVGDSRRPRRPPGSRLACLPSRLGRRDPDCRRPVPLGRQAPLLGLQWGLSLGRGRLRLLASRLRPSRQGSPAWPGIPWGLSPGPLLPHPLGLRPGPDALHPKVGVLVLPTGAGAVAPLPSEDHRGTILGGIFSLRRGPTLCKVPARRSSPALIGRGGTPPQVAPVHPEGERVEGQGEELCERRRGLPPCPPIPGWASTGASTAGGQLARPSSPLC